MNARRQLLAVCASGWLAGCASTPMHFHTLVPAAVNGGPDGPLAQGHVAVESVRIPAQVDRAEWVVRQRDGGVALVENEEWIAPLTDELRTAMLDELVRKLAPEFIESERGKGWAMSVRLDVERFESAPARYALIDAVWRVQVKDPMRELQLTCRSRAYETVGPGYAALERGHQRAVVVISDQIAEASRGLVVLGQAACPRGPAEAK